jgi:starch synthase
LPSPPLSVGTSEKPPVIALIPWGLAIEDFLEPNSLTLEMFCKEFRGSWMFGYVDALRTAGVETVVLCVSRGVRRVTRLVHEPTGARVVALPLPRANRTLRRMMRDPYGRSTRQAFGKYRGLLAWPLLAPLKELGPYGATPLRALVEELHTVGADAVICQEYEFPRFDVLALSKRTHGIPVFGVFQGGDYRRWRFESLLRARAIRASDGLVIGTQAELGRVQKRYHLPKHKVASIPNPVDVGVWKPGDRMRPRSVLGLPADCRVALWHGRVELPKKGLDVLLEAWRAISRDPDARDLRLVLIGDGPDASTIKQMIDRLDLRNVLFMNHILNDPIELASYVRAADVYVFPSRHEGLAVAPVEAMACGLPVVATDCGGMPDILGVDDEAAGMIVRRNDLGALGEALRDLLYDDARRKQLGIQARRRALQVFSLEAVGKQLRTFLLGDETRQRDDQRRSRT